ncbi:MAG TPA: hypothetical protein VN025_03260 [Candidatus Dormibacteraeota bacterium]|jgi:hypothetical protein|nr:hypothetical protein [Candidatus Dormibacteraeota bacterium]
MAIEEDFPNLVKYGYRVTSVATREYNCIAWAAGVNDDWWDPGDGYTWPEGAPREYTREALISAYRAIGFEICAGNQLEPGFDKIALYADGDDWTHAARQLENGKWTSKLGRNEDIEHNTPDAVSDTQYGKVICFMKRTRQ